MYQKKCNGSRQRSGLFRYGDGRNSYESAFDEVIDAMGEIGEMMPGGLKETSQAGLAVTETGKRVALDLAKRNQTPQC